MKKYLVTIFFLGLFVPLLALMPPHFRSSVPADGGVFYNNTIVLKGYSLKYLKYYKFIVKDLHTKKQMKYAKDLTCKWIGEGNRPGDKQMKCTMIIKLKNAVKGRYYLITYRSFKVTLRSGGLK